MKSFCVSVKSSVYWSSSSSKSQSQFDTSPNRSRKKRRVEVESWPRNEPEHCLDTNSINNTVIDSCSRENGAANEQHTVHIHSSNSSHDQDVYSRLAAAATAQFVLHREHSIARVELPVFVAVRNRQESENTRQSDRESSSICLSPVNIDALLKSLYSDQQIPDSQPTSQPDEQRKRSMSPLLGNINLQGNYRVAAKPPLTSDILKSTFISGSAKALTASLQDLPHTPSQDSQPSSVSTFTSPDQIPTRIPQFSGGLTLAQLIGTDKMYIVYYDLPESNSQDDCDKMPRNVLNRIRRAAFKHKSGNFYAPLARCVRLNLNDKPKPPEQFERGYWRIDVVSWTSRDKLRFWTDMTDRILSGRVGLIGAVLDIDDGDIIRVYCFGGEVESVYVFLYIMSDCKTRNTAKWIDGTNTTVIEMADGDTTVH
ncbi:hypothetical protein V1512DRAFT_263588 [Lipomyces arxii]|uniref:uncharacterized protein n=1 Tax=Lipomyces arxii TaxID=56418 RepID=UPI0034CD2013